MVIRANGPVDFQRIDIRTSSNKATNHFSTQESAEVDSEIDLQQELSNAAEEMADILSVFGRFARGSRKNANSNVDNETFSSILEDHAEEKLDKLIRQVSKLHNQSNILNFARGFFPNDSDLILALREMLLSRRLSESLKKKIKEAINDLNKFGNQQKIQSGINIGRLAKRFSAGAEGQKLSAMDLRTSYLRFLELELPASYLYQDWIDEFGCANRKRLLSFTLSALVADMKANVPGIHFEEFGPLSSKLSDARVLHTLDLALNDSFNGFKFREQLRNGEIVIAEDDIVNLYLKGLTEFQEFKPSLKKFNDNFMRLLLVKQRAEIIQTLRSIYNQTLDNLFSDIILKDSMLDFLSSLLAELYKKERVVGVWSEYYK